MIYSQSNLTTADGIPAYGRYKNGIITINQDLLTPGRHAEAIGALFEEYGEHQVEMSGNPGSHQIDKGAQIGKQLLNSLIAEADQSPNQTVTVPVTVSGKRHHLTATADELRNVAQTNFTDQRIHNPIEDEKGRYQSRGSGAKNPYENLGRTNDQVHYRVSDLYIWKFKIREGLIYSPFGTTYKAFSGDGKMRNNPDFQGNDSGGPLPLGRYFIVKRPNGGGISGFFVDRARRAEGDLQFALFKDDGEIDDKTVIKVKKMVNGKEVIKEVTRDKFRLHGGRYSLGCVTMKDVEFEKLANELINKSPNSRIIDVSYDVELPAYGILDVE